MPKPSEATDRWLELHATLVSVATSVAECVAAQSEGDPVAQTSYTFVAKAGRTLEGVVLLTRAGLMEQAQVLVRVLIELRITFQYFTQMANEDLAKTILRINDSMILEKMKQMRASDFAGLDLIEGAPSKEDFEATESSI